jgi:hypothetical protein
MPYGVVLLPEAGTRTRLVALAESIGASASPLMLVGATAPPHVSVLHVDSRDGEALRAWVRANPGPVRVTLTGLTFKPTPPGDYYVPEGGLYFGLEVVKRPDLEALHRSALEWTRGTNPLGFVGDEFRPHLTLGVLAGRPSLPDFRAMPTGELELTPAVGEVGPYGTFPGLA